MRILRPHLILCIISAALGALAATVWWHLPAHTGIATAQEPTVPQPPRLSKPTVRLAVPGAATDAGTRPAVFAASRPEDAGDELTAEERTHVAVYEATNRSVVNISTM